MKVAINCKTDMFPMTAIAHCQVSGVDFAPGSKFSADSSAREYLLSTGAAEDATETVAAEVPPTTGQPSEEPQHKKVTKTTRITRGR